VFTLLVLILLLVSSAELGTNFLANMLTSLSKLARDQLGLSVSVLTVNLSGIHIGFDRIEHNIPGFPRFEIALWSPELMGIERGKSQCFSAKQTPYVVESRVLPESTCTPLGGPVDTLWSEHCALYVRFEPLPK
jgi:hypothetical protein